MSAKEWLRARTRRVRMRIRGGPNASLLWSVPTRLNFLRGTYEARLAAFVASHVVAGDVFWDIGAHFGYYTLLAARAVGSAGRVYAFEPSARNVWFLEHHLRWNHVSNVHVAPLALGGADGERSFGGRGTGSGRLGVGGHPVRVRTMDSLVQSGEAQAPTFVKLDVQGAETEVLRGAVHTLSRSPDVLLVVATHAQVGPTIHQDCLDLLRSYQLRVWDHPERKLIVAASHGRRVEPLPA